MTDRFPGRLAVQQRVLPSYRVPFFDLLAQSCEGGLSLFTGSPRPGESIASADTLLVANYRRGDNLHLLGGPLYFCVQRGLLPWLADWDPDALILEANPRYLATPSAVKWMHARSRMVIGWGLGAPQFSGPLSGFRRGSWVRFINRFDALIAYSRRGADEYAALGFPPHKIFVAPNAVSPASGNPAASRPASFKVRPAILFVGRLQARKRLDSLLRACSEMPGLQPRLIIVGDGPEMSDLVSLAQEVYPSAEFIGELHGPGLDPYFAQADLFVLPGTGGLAVQQAMSHGLPVLVAKGDGTQDDLVRESNGWQIAPENYNALVEALRLALSDGKRLRAMGKESYRIVKEEINIEKMVEVFVTALNSPTLAPSGA